MGRRGVDMLVCVTVKCYEVGEALRDGVRAWRLASWVSTRRCKLGFLIFSHNYMYGVCTKH